MLRASALAFEDDFASLMEGKTDAPNARRTDRRLRTGEVVEGTVVQIGRDWVFVDVGTTSEARIERAELADDKGKLQVQVGDRLRASVARISDEGPLLALSLGRGARTGVDRSQLKDALRSRLPVQGKVTRAVKGGVEVDVAGVRAFCPASQLGQGYVADLATFEGQTFDFLVADIKDDGRSVVLSRRALLEEEKARAAKSVLERIQVGGEHQGTVSALQKYGAFIDLGGGVEGLVHVSELAHSRVDRVEDLLAVGDTVTVKVLALEPQDKSPIPRLRLSIKALTRAPELPSIALDEVLEGTVTRVGSFGVRVMTAKGEGLVPVRELGVPRGSDHHKAFSVGASVKVVLVHRDTSSGRTTFSCARVADVEEKANFRAFTEGDSGRGQAGATMGSFGDLFRRKLGLPVPAPETTRIAAEPSVSKPAAPEPSLPVAPRDPARENVSFADVMHGHRLEDPAERAASDPPNAPLPDGVFKRRR